MRIVYFSWVRERIGTDCEEVSVPADVIDVSGLVDWLSERGAGHAAAFADRSRLRAAVDQAFVPFDASIVGASEVAIFPPVTGG
jgi:molybdopterin synthase sulfur carrier subunit